MSDFRLCSTCWSRSQAGLCHCTQRAISDRSEPTIERLRYSLGGDRPSQTAHHALSRPRMNGTRLDIHNHKGGISRFGSTTSWRPSFKAYHLSYTSSHECQCKATVKVHGVFPSDRRNPASSRGIQFH